MNAFAEHLAITDGTCPGDHLGQFGHICHYCDDGRISKPTCWSCGRSFKCSECTGDPT